MKIDLHCHSTASDGLYSPEILMDLARIRAIDVLALTDHDTLAGVDEAQNYAQGLQLIPGIELSTQYQGESIHVLGYFSPGNHHQPELDAALEEFRSRRDARALEIAARLREFYDLDIDVASLLVSPGASVGRPHLAGLIRAKYGYDFPTIFQKYLGNHTKAYVPSSNLAYEDGLALLNRAGATVILAHPGDYKTPVEELLRSDLHGLECYYPKHSPNETSQFLKICQDQNLLVTAGSDDHGQEKGYHGSLGETPFLLSQLEPFLAKMGITVK